MKRKRCKVFMKKKRYIEINGDIGTANNRKNNSEKKDW